MKVYISGKIGEEVPSDEIRIEFTIACAVLSAMGHECFNPICSGLGSIAERLAKLNGTTFYEEILLLNLMELKKCDAILMLPDWNQSPSAQVEYQFAKVIGKSIRFAKRGHAEEYLMKQWCAIPENGKRRLSHATVKDMKKYVDEHINEIWLPI